METSKVMRRKTLVSAATVIIACVLVLPVTSFAQGSDYSNILRLTAASGPYSDETVMRFTPSATYDFDGDWDAYKLSNGGNTPNFYTVMKATRFAINSFPGDFSDLEVVLKLDPAFTGSYTISATGLDSTFDNTYSVVLEDRLMNVNQDLWTNPVYTCNVTQGDTATRFYIHFTKAVIAPVEPVIPSILASAASQDHSQVVLTWTTSNEQAGYYYSVFRSSDGQNYTFAASLPAVVQDDSSGNYEWRDSDARTGHLYYQIRQADASANMIAAETVEVDFKAIDFAVFPNPSNGVITVGGVEKISRKTTYQILDPSGMVIYEKTITPEDNASELRLDLTGYHGILSIQEITDQHVQVKRVIVM